MLNVDPHDDAFYERKLKQYSPHWEQHLEEPMLLCQVLRLIREAGKRGKKKYAVEETQPWTPF